MDLYNAISIVKEAFDENELCYSNEIRKDRDGTDYCKFSLEFQNGCDCEVYIVDDMCDITVRFRELPACPQNRVFEVGKLFSEFNFYSRFFTWRLNPSDGEVTLSYSFIITDALDEERRFMSIFNLGIDNDIKEKVPRIKSLYVPSTGNKNKSNTIKLKL